MMAVVHVRRGRQEWTKMLYSIMLELAFIAFLALCVIYVRLDNRRRLGSKVKGARHLERSTVSVLVISSDKEAKPHVEETEQRFPVEVCRLPVGTRR